VYSSSRSASRSGSRPRTRSEHEMGMCRSRAGRPASIGDPGHPRSHSPGPRLECPRTPGRCRAVWRRAVTRAASRERARFALERRSRAQHPSHTCSSDEDIERAVARRCRDEARAGRRVDLWGRSNRRAEYGISASTNGHPLVAARRRLRLFVPCWRGRVEDSILSLGRRGTQAVRC